MSTPVEHTRIIGDVAVSRNVAAGGNAIVQGDTVLKGNVTIEGLLDAQNIKGVEKGLFTTYADLAEHYPYPCDGWWAIVGERIPGYIYRANGGVWINTGEKGGILGYGEDEFDERYIRAGNVPNSVDGIKNFLQGIKLNGISLTYDVVSDTVKIEQAGLTIGSFVAGLSGARIAENGEAEIATAVVRGLASVLGDLSVGGNASIAGNETVTGLTKALGGAEFGNYVQSTGDSGRGGRIDAAGNADLESAKIRGVLYAMEYVLNKISVQGSESIFTEGGTIVSVTPEIDGTYTCTMKKETETSLIEFQPHDVLKGIMNTILQGGGMYTSFVKVNEVDQNAFTINVSVYADNQVPAGVNYPPCALMTYRRWGNEVEANESGHTSWPSIVRADDVNGQTVYTNTRQSVWYISGAEKRIVFLDGVTKPILDDDENGSNYSGFFGLPIQGLHAIPSSAQIDYTQPYLYLRGIICQNMWKVDYNGIPVRQQDNRGEWALPNPQSEYYSPYEYNSLHQSLVYHYGCQWSCLHEGALTEPKEGSTEWMLLIGDPRYNVFIDVTNDGRVRLGSPWELEAEARVEYANQDITSDLLNREGVTFEWARNSGYPADDANYTPTVGDTANKLVVTNNDVGPHFVETRVCKFTVYINIPEVATPLEQSLNFNI